jgi:hypothetical protein
VEDDRLMRPSWQFMMAATAVSLLLVATGGLWALAPNKYVSLYKRLYRANARAHTAQWERETVSASSRLIGAFLFVAGCMMLWTIYSPLIRSSLSRSP